ncbi:hypothetical protein HDU92_001182 [Lobulomyces angularis]|nr:hypothetical protein HDU92_001182 [Lobulomyces angularis]
MIQIDQYGYASHNNTVSSEARNSKVVRQITRVINNFRENIITGKKQISIYHYFLDWEEPKFDINNSATWYPKLHQTGAIINFERSGLIYDFFITLGELVKFLKSSRGKDSDFLKVNDGWKNRWLHFTRDFIDLRDGLTHNVYQVRFVEDGAIFPRREGATSRKVGDVVKICWNRLDDILEALKFIKQKSK